MPTYPLPPGTRIYHRVTGQVFELLDPPGQFRTISGTGAGGTFENMPYYQAVCMNPNPGLVEVLDCPAKIRKFEVQTQEDDGL